MNKESIVDTDLETSNHKYTFFFTKNTNETKDKCLVTLCKYCIRQNPSTFLNFTDTELKNDSLLMFR